MSSVTLRSVDPASPDAQRLVRALDDDLSRRYPGADIQPIDADAIRTRGGVFLVGYEDETPVACGALVPAGDGIGEVKRMFVLETARRRGHARAVLSALEERARQRDLRVVRLETGDRQPEAMSLYETLGYRRIPCFGDYAGSPHSRCFEKQIASTDRVP